MRCLFSFDIFFLPAIQKKYKQHFFEFEYIILYFQRNIKFFGFNILITGFYQI